MEALLRPEAGGTRFVVASPERFSFGLAAKIIEDEFEWAEANEEEQVADQSCGLDGETASRELGFRYRNLRETVIDTVAQAAEMSRTIWEGDS